MNTVKIILSLVVACALSVRMLPAAYGVTRGAASRMSRQRNNIEWWPTDAKPAPVKMNRVVTGGGHKFRAGTSVG